LTDTCVSGKLRAFPLSKLLITWTFILALPPIPAVFEQERNNRQKNINGNE